MSESVTAIQDCPLHSWSLQAQVQIDSSQQGTKGSWPTGKIKISIADQRDGRGTTRFAYAILGASGESVFEQLLTGNGTKSCFLSAESMDSLWKSRAPQEVSLKEGDHKRLSLAIAPSPDARVTKWGAVHLVAPGIAVDLLNGQDAGFVGFVKDLISAIKRVPVGNDLLGEFDPAKAPSVFRRIAEANSGGAYKDVTVTIQQALGMNLPGGKVKLPTIETKNFGGRKDDGGKVFTGGQIPCVSLVPPPPQGQTLQLGSGIEIGHDGVLRHPDFVQMEAFDIVLFHELCHAWYEQAGISPQMSAQAQPNKGLWQDVGSHDAQNTTEEQLVSGLLAGKGLKYCENHYRQQAGRALRPSYVSVSIKSDPELAGYRWPTSGFTDPASVLKANGFSFKG